VFQRQPVSFIDDLDRLGATFAGTDVALTYRVTVGRIVNNPSYLLLDVSAS
jgi:hypothetical protein